MADKKLIEINALLDVVDELLQFDINKDENRWTLPASKFLLKKTKDIRNEETAKLNKKIRSTDKT